MKAVFVAQQSQIKINDIQSPQLKSPGDIIVRMKACGLCGSDLEKIYGAYGMSSGRLGHEPAGAVIRVGDNVKDFAIGDRVFVHHHVACYSCHYCRHGDFTMCQNYQSSNIDPCGLAEEFVVPEWNVSRGGVIRLPDSVGFEAASLIEPLACCLRALKKCRLQKGDDVAVLGAGPAGIMHLLLAKTLGAGTVFVSDVNQFRLDFAERLGAVALSASSGDLSSRIKSATGQRGVDACIIATSSIKAVSQAFEITRKGGDIMLFGVPAKGSELTIDASKLYSSEHSIIPSYAASELETNEAIRLIEAHRIEIESIITHRFDISASAAAIKCAHEGKDAMKVIVTTKDH